MCVGIDIPTPDTPCTNVSVTDVRGRGEEEEEDEDGNEGIGKVAELPLPGGSEASPGTLLPEKKVCIHS